MNDKDNYHSPFPKRLRLLFDETRCSQQEVADVIGVSRQAISQWRNGLTNPDAFNFRKLAEFFNVPLEYLFGDTDSRVKENQVLADSLGLSDFSIQKLQAWNEKFRFSIPMTEVLSRIIDDADFNTFMIKSQAMIAEYVDHQRYLHSENRVHLHPDDEIQAEARYDVSDRARELGLRTVRAEDLPDFYRQQALESIGKALTSVAEKYWEDEQAKQAEASDRADA